MGATIEVCPGIYNEQVRIVGHSHDGLKLRSLKPQQATIHWPAVETAPLALVDVDSANSVVLRGFVVSGPFTYDGCSPDRHEGVLIEGGASLLLNDNHITQIKNSVPALYGCQEGDAVSVGRRPRRRGPPRSSATRSTNTRRTAYRSSTLAPSPPSITTWCAARRPVNRTLRPTASSSSTVHNRRSASTP